MPELTTKPKQALIENTTSPKEGGGNSKLKGMTYSQQQSALAAGQSSDVTGPIGRVFNRILGLADDAKGTATKSFNKKAMKGYLDNRLKLADGEWFRGAKLDGVTDKLMETLDKDGDGLVGWTEFQAFQADVLQTIAPGAKSGDDPEAVGRSASQTFDQMERGKKNGSLDYDELQAGVKGNLPKDTDHADLVAQLGARIALDAVDTDQRSAKVKDRQLSKTEWTTAAQQMAR